MPGADSLQNFRSMLGMILPGKSDENMTDKERFEKNFGGRQFFQTTLSFVLTPLTYLAFVLNTLNELLYCSFVDFLWPQLVPKFRTDISGEMPLEFFDPDTLVEADWRKLREYIHIGRPFVLRRKNGAQLSDVAPPEEAVSGFKDDKIRIRPISLFASLPGLDELIRKLYPWSMRAYWPLWFLGQYSQGKAHVDHGPHLHNCYFLRCGMKDVIIVPPEVTKLTPLVPGIDGHFVDGSESEGREYLAGLPYYYRVDLPPQSLLVFNNATSIHHFRNRRGPDGRLPEALSIRMKHTSCAEPRLWRELLAGPKTWETMSRYTIIAVRGLFSGSASEDRDPRYL